MNIFKCDMCGKETKINPKTEPIYELDEKGEPKKDKKGDPIPVMTVVESMNFSSGKMIKQQVPKVKDLEPRAHIIKINAGTQAIMRDVCSDCLPKIMPEIQALWDKLKTLRPQ